MEYTNVQFNDGTYRIPIVSLKCPFCGLMEIPHYLYGYNDTKGNFVVFQECSNPNCKKVFSVLFINHASRGISFEKICPPPLPVKETFSDIISKVSPTFIDIYNQALAAEQLGLDQICGVGFRKSLEFLIKDYLISNLENNDIAGKEAIKRKSLGSCIERDVTDTKIKTVVKRAAWLGNDETHYVRKWEDKQVCDLKALIKLTIRWIESEIETKRLLDEMPDSKV
jgi:hypothetical protein